MTELEKIQKQTGLKANSCKCKMCRSFCHKNPCIGTPMDILKIIDAGFIDKVAPTFFAAGMQYGVPIIQMIAPIRKDDGSCIFLNENELCSLHDLGLKPTEGKLCNHITQVATPQKAIAFVVARTWDIRNPSNNIKAIAHVIDRLVKHGNTDTDKAPIILPEKIQ